MYLAQIRRSAAPVHRVSALPSVHREQRTAGALELLRESDGLVCIV